MRTHTLIFVHQSHVMNVLKYAYKEENLNRKIKEREENQNKNQRKGKNHKGL